jgi:hypothetical protein
MSELGDRLRDEIIAEGTSPRDLTRFVAARFVATDIAEIYGRFSKEVGVHATTPEKMCDLLLGHAVVIASLIHATALGKHTVEKILLEMIEHNLTRGAKK